jgi:outer membrane biosynthesis protein TonB
MMERSSLYGKVILKVCVDKRGRVVSAIAVDGHPMAYAAALDSVKDWIFNPYLVNGKPKRVTADLEVEYDFRSRNTKSDSKE